MISTNRIVQRGNCTVTHGTWLAAIRETQCQQNGDQEIFQFHIVRWISDLIWVHQGNSHSNNNSSSLWLKQKPITANTGKWRENVHGKCYASPLCHSCRYLYSNNQLKFFYFSCLVETIQCHKLIMIEHQKVRCSITIRQCKTAAVVCHLNQFHHQNQKIIVPSCLTMIAWAMATICHPINGIQRYVV